PIGCSCAATNTPSPHPKGAIPSARAAETRAYGPVQYSTSIVECTGTSPGAADIDATVGGSVPRQFGSAIGLAVSLRSSNARVAASSDQPVTSLIVTMPLATTRFT